MNKDFKPSELLKALAILEEKDQYANENKLPTKKFEKMNELVNICKIIVNQNNAEDMEIKYTTEDGFVTMQGYVIGGDKKEIQSWQELLDVVDCFEVDTINNGTVEFRFTVLDIFKVPNASKRFLS